MFKGFFVVWRFAAGVDARVQIHPSAEISRDRDNAASFTLSAFAFFPSFLWTPCGSFGVIGAAANCVS